jgi:hypothetical protein
MGEKLQFDRDFKLLNIFYKSLNICPVMPIRIEDYDLVANIRGKVAIANAEQ